MRFQKGEIIVRNDLAYPEGALVVEGSDASDNTLAHPLGGGLQLSIPATDLERFMVATEFEKTPVFHHASFEIEGIDGQFAGWWDGRAWNGWAMPHFEFEEAERVLAAVAPGRWRYDTVSDVFITEDPEGEDETWPAAIISLPDGGEVKVYPLGSASWIWEEILKGSE